MDGGWRNARMEGCMHPWMGDEWMDGRQMDKGMVEGWVDRGRMDGGWMDGLIDK